jgi:hypothetical protein
MRIKYYCLHEVEKVSTIFWIKLIDMKFEFRMEPGNTPRKLWEQAGLTQIVFFKVYIVKLCEVFIVDVNDCKSRG